MIQKIIKKFGNVAVDLFASCINHKVKRYYSYAVGIYSCGVNCSSRNWSEEIICVFPPYPVISRMLKKIEEHRTTVVNIISLFITQPWFSRLLTILIENLLILPKTNTINLFFLQKNRNAHIVKCDLEGKYFVMQSHKTKGILDAAISIFMESWKPETQIPYIKYTNAQVQFCFK